MTRRPGPDERWHALSVEACLDAMRSSPLGLSPEEASERLREEGLNELVPPRRVAVLGLLLDQFRNVLIVMLLIAMVLSAALGHGVEAVAIGVIVLFAGLLGFAQEYRAEKSMDALREMAAPMSSVVRGGIEMKVPARELVRGDVVLLSAGDRVPADGRLIEAVNLRTEEAALTGESVPVEKRAQAVEGAGAEIPIGDRLCMVHAGTSATYGRGRAVVVETGMDTEIGKVARILQDVEVGRTPLQENLDHVGKALARAALAVVGVIVVLGLYRGQPFLDMLIFGIALAVAVVPEALPAVVTISLALGVQRMARRNALVRRLPAVETLGCATIICSDKTGTLTRDEMTVREVYVDDRQLHVTGAGYEPVGEFLQNGSAVTPNGDLTSLLTAAVLASDAHVDRDEETGRWVVKGDPTEGALVVAAAKAGLRKGDLDAAHPRVDEVPFTSETKRMTTIHETPGGLTAFAKGAPEVVLGSCSMIHSSGAPRPLSGEDRARVLEVAHRLAENALRVLGVASRPASGREDAEREMTFLGLIGMIDPARPEAAAAIRRCGEAGIKVVMITGDHAVTARAVARELGIFDGGLAVSGPELDALDDQDLRDRVENMQVFARVSPAHKLRVVSALQERGHVAAMTGDGVNDAPALKKADIGIAMGINGTDVARESAAMTLTDDNFASIVAAVEEGRGIFGNIKKYLMYLLSSNIGEIGLMAGATLLGMPLPLTAVMLLYVNLATDGLPALALAIDPHDTDLMRHPPREPRSGIFSRPVIILILVGGLWSAFTNLAVFYWALNVAAMSLREAMTLTFLCLVFIQFFKAYNFRSDRQSVLVRPFANRWLNIAIVWEVLLLFAVIYTPFLERAFQTDALPARDWLIAAVVAFTVVPVLELAKWCERRGWFGVLSA
jgi:Ca2+-transporting ATPase